MSVHHRLLAGTYYLLKAARVLRRPFRLASPHSLRVLLYHDIAPDEKALFELQLRWLAQSWKFVSPQQFAAMITGDEPIRGRNVLLTFDDGFASNRVVAEQILRPRGIQALFFVVSDFIAIADPIQARQFIAQNILPERNAPDLPEHLSNMHWSDLEALLEQGHTIGAHTRTHARLSQVAAQPDLELEIVDSADTLAHRLGAPIEHFAYTFGDVGSFSAEALAIARRRFRFVYSGLRGDNAKNASPLILCRDAATSRDSLALLGAYLEGAADFHYSQSRARLGTWI